MRGVLLLLVCACGVEAAEPDALPVRKNLLPVPANKSPANVLTGKDFNFILDRVWGEKVRISLSDSFAGYAGTAATGAPRLRLGTNTPMAQQANGDADDAAILILRNLTGDSLFSHAIRDESTFNTTTTGAYASFDSIPTMNGTTHYNHLRSFQARPEYKASGSIDEVNGFQYQLAHYGSGTVEFSYGIHLVDAQGEGPIQNNYGIRIKPLTRGSSNVGIFVDANDNYLLGKLVISGPLEGVTQFAMSSELSATGANLTGTPHEFKTNGGIGVWGYAGEGYAVVKAYSNSGGTEKNLSLQPSGGQVGIGTTTPQATLHVNGTVRIGNVPVHADNTAALAGGLVAGDLYRTATGQLMVVFTP